jgi:hypothetical protein
MALCGVHIERTAIENNKNKIINSSFIDIAQADISMLRNAVGSQCQFKSLALIILEEWRRLGEHVFAVYFEREYLTPPYDMWSCNSFPEAIATPVENNFVESSHKTDKRDNLGAGHRKKVGLSSFCIISLLELLANYTSSHSGRPFSLKADSISTGYPSYILKKALLLITEVKDDRVKSISKYSQSQSQSDKSRANKAVYVKNFEHVPIGSTIVQNQPKSTKGYIVFNSHDRFVQTFGASNNVTRPIALQVIDSVLSGRFPRSMKYDEIKNFVQSYHLLEYEVLHVNGTRVYQYNCKCKAGRSEDECSHEAAGEEINKTFSISEQLQLIETGTVQGRPKLTKVVAFQAHRPEEKTACHDKVEKDYSNWVLEPIVQFFDEPFSPKAFVGKVTGTYIACH